MTRLIRISLLFFVFGQLASALEVGETAKCVVLEGLTAEGTPTTGCIRDRVKPTQTHTIIDFFSVFCDSCKASLPAFHQLAEELADHATVRLVSVDRKIEDIKAYLEDVAAESQINFPLAFDLERDATRAYGVNATPTTFIINKKNVVLFKHLGGLTEADIAEMKKIILQ